MPPKKLVQTKKQSDKKKESVDKVEDIAIETIADLDDTNIDDDENDELFDENAYDIFTKKYGIESIVYKNTDEIHKEDIIIKHDDRITSEIMTQAEFTRIVSERAKQIENGAMIFISLLNEHDPIKIAEKEIKQKMCPLKIIRYLTENIKEEWAVNEMIIPFGINI